jgi:hypothetical protein
MKTLARRHNIESLVGLGGSVAVRHGNTLEKYPAC